MKVRKEGQRSTLNGEPGIQKAEPGTLNAEPGTGNAERRTQNGKPRTLNGFSLLEMLVVLLIIAVTMGLFFRINFRQKESVIIRSFSSEMSMFMAAARGQAIVHGRENICLYLPDSGMITEELKGRELPVPEGVELVFEDSDKTGKRAFASFYPDGSIVLEDFFIRSLEHKFVPEADPFMGRVRFEAE